MITVAEVEAELEQLSAGEPIVARTGRSLSTVERHLRMVRFSWHPESS